MSGGRARSFEQGRRHGALVLVAVLVGCSSDPNGADGGAGSTGSSGGGCAGTYCLERRPDIGVDPDKLLFADLGAGSEQKLEISVVNTGGPGPLDIAAAEFRPPTDDFALEGFAPTSLDPGGHVRWAVVYKPHATGGKALNLVVKNNSHEAARRAFPVPIVVTAGSGVLKAVPDPVDFGTVASKTTATTKAHVFNQGDKTVSIESVALDPNGSPDFAIVQTPGTPFDLAPQASFEVELSFAPALGGNDTTGLLVGYGKGRVLTVGVVGAEKGPLIAVVPGALNYGQVADGAKQTRSFKIFSKGKADLHIAKVEVDPASAFNGLMLSAAGPFTIPPEASRVIDVTLTGDKTLPDKTAAVATIVIHSDDPNIATVKVPVMVAGEPCVAGSSSFSLKAVAAKGQVDIIVAIDTSGSMKEEMKAVAANLNAFSKTIAAKNVDHHVVLIGTGMCVPPPLASPGCGNSAAFRHIQVKIDSHNGLERIIQTYPQWQTFLRAGAQRHFVMITDDNSKKSASWFQQQIAALKNPGFPDGFTFHSIVGWAPQVVPFVGCIGAAGHGTVYIELTKKTGGELASICPTQLGVPPNWSGLFAKIGQNVVSTIKVACKYDLPAEKDGKKVDPATITLTHSASDGSDAVIQRFESEAHCPANTHGWYFDNPSAPAAAVLCPASCKQLEGQKLAFHFGC